MLKQFDYKGYDESVYDGYDPEYEDDSTLGKTVVQTSCGVISYEVPIDDFNDMQLTAHNLYRDIHGVEPLAYDANLAADAQRYAERLALHD